MRRGVLFFLFTLSGFSGLIYESIWTHYLKLFLGHAAYAQTLVLAIFMGGMAIGSWLCSRLSGRWKNLLLGYALAEGIIGLCALLFHAAFTGTIELSYERVIPQLGTPFTVSVFKWCAAALMILPQSVLLGMTFPLMSAGILRLFPDRPGRTIGLLYFTNSIGAAVGVLVSGFVLIEAVGLPGTIGIAGAINIALAIVVWRLSRAGQDAVPEETVDAAAPSGDASYWYRPLLLASLVTGLASFIYEIGWIRMLSLVLGTSTHAFELMLSAFILGLACGGLWIQRRIDRIAQPARYLAWVQVIMGCLALGTLLLYGNTFSAMQWLIKALPKSDTGYVLFNLASSAIAMSVMLPATFCAGMTLPLITYLLLRGGEGEKSIGAVYAANTVGAIIGVFFAIHVGMPQLGLKGLISVGAGLDIMLGLCLFWWLAWRGGWSFRPFGVTALGMGALAATLLFVQLDPYKMASGVFRSGNLLQRDNHTLLYHRDGKTATVSLHRNQSGTMFIRTNGKTDAAISMDERNEPHADEPTMTLLAAIPMLLHPAARDAAVVGLGSGMTTHVLLTNPRLSAVDTVEIEQGMVDAAHGFRPRVELAFSDPRSRIHIDDAKTFFSTHNKKYDLIISEPSNPWVSGVAGLFSGEFYRLVKRHLREDGLFVQWVQLYEIDVELVASVLKAVSGNFADYAVYAANGGDILIVAREKRLPENIPLELLNEPALAGALKKVYVNGEQDIAIRRIGAKKDLDPLVRSFSIRANSDYHPVLDQKAARTRFLGSRAEELIQFTHVPLPAMDILSGKVRTDVTRVTSSPFFPRALSAATAMALRDYYLAGTNGSGNAAIPQDMLQKAARVRQLFERCGQGLDEFEGMASLFDVAITVIPYLSTPELTAFWASLEKGACSGKLPERERRWVTLFKAVSLRDSATMASAARTIIKQEHDLPLPALRYAVAAAMLGSLVEGRPAEAAALWGESGPLAGGGGDPGLLFRLLAAKATDSR